MKKKNKKLVAITEYPHPIQRAFRLTRSNRLDPENKKNLTIRTQNFKKDIMTQELLHDRLQMFN